MIIAIDGPAAAGKGAIAKLLAQHYHLPHLDTGLTYRCAAYMALKSGVSFDDKENIIKAAQNVNLEALDPHILSNSGIAEAASRIATIEGVRKVLTEKQRAFAHQPCGAILEGRDIGTVVCPQAEVKLYITADQEIRAQRRMLDILKRGEKTCFKKVLDDIKCRDERDTTRHHSPLKKDKDAHLLNTTEMSIETAFQEAKRIIGSILQKTIKKEG